MCQWVPLYELCLYKSKVKLDSDNPEAIKDLNEVTVDDSSETNELFTNSDISHLPTENEFLGSG